MDRGAWQATVHGVTKSWTRLTFTFSFDLQSHQKLLNTQNMIDDGNSVSFQLECIFKSVHVCMCVCMLSHLSRVQLFVTPWTVAFQAPLSMGFSRQEYWSGLPFPSSGDFPDPVIELRSPALEADALTSEPPSLET